MRQDSSETASLMSENEKLQCAFRESGFLAYRDKIIGISSGIEDKDSLMDFFRSFTAHRKSVRFLLYLFSTQMLLGKSTAVLKRDLDELPRPNSAFFTNISWWENILIADVLKYFAEMIRTGQNSEITRRSVDIKHFETYAKTFVKLLGSVYTNLRPGKSGTFNGLAFQAFYFGESCELDWPEDWADKLESVVFKGEGTSLLTTRVLRFYEKNTLIIIKPDRLRHWLGSTAIRDADETLVDLQQQGF